MENVIFEMQTGPTGPDLPAVSGMREQSFSAAEAASVFYDRAAVTAASAAAAFCRITTKQLIGKSMLGRFCSLEYLEEGNVIRILSARPASGPEIKAYLDPETAGGYIRCNPVYGRLKRYVTVCISNDAFDTFRNQAQKKGTPETEIISDYLEEVSRMA